MPNICTLHKKLTKKSEFVDKIPGGGKLNVYI